MCKLTLEEHCVKFKAVDRVRQKHIKFKVSLQEVVIQGFILTLRIKIQDLPFLATFSEIQTFHLCVYLLYSDIKLKPTVL